MRSILATITVVLLLLAATVRADAQSEQGFAVQVSPSPLIATVQPGVESTLELRIRNTGTETQALKMGTRSFAVDDSSGQVKLGEDDPVSVRDVVSFVDPLFTLHAGEIFTQRIHVNPPADSGFTYDFAVTIAQQNPPKAAKGSSAISGSVAVFTLINVDRAGSTRQFTLSSVSASKHTYEFLPVTISVKLKNTGNTSVQPVGTVFIKRKASDNRQLAALPLNQDGGYIVPGSTRTFNVSWSDGFPRYETVKEGDTTRRKLVWRGGLDNLRFGRYIAQVVALYNDGQRDVPIMAEVSFWVIPWRIILGLVLASALLLAGLYMVLRALGKVVGGMSRKVHSASDESKNQKL